MVLSLNGTCCSQICVQFFCSCHGFLSSWKGIISFWNLQRFSVAQHLISNPSVIQCKWIHVLSGFLLPPHSWFVWATRWRWICIHADRMGARYRSNLHDAVSGTQQCCQQKTLHQQLQPVPQWDVMGHLITSNHAFWASLFLTRHSNFRFTFGEAAVFLTRKTHTLGFNLFYRKMYLNNTPKGLMFNTYVSYNQSPE